jgi:hypothetical protein
MERICLNLVEPLADSEIPPRLRKQASRSDRRLGLAFGGCLGGIIKKPGERGAVRNSARIRAIVMMGNADDDDCSVELASG